MKRKFPHTYVIIFYIIVIAAAITWIVPGGQFERTTQLVNGMEKTVLEKDSFHFVPGNPQSWQVFTALFKGFVKQSGIIIFILMIGGAFWIMNASKAIDVGILSFLNFTKKLEHLRWLQKIGVNNIIITLIMIVFSIFGAVFGMSEETIAFIIILVPLAISMGYDSIVGVNMVFVAAGLGFAGAVLNPFTIGIAQGIADLPLFSGFEYRIITWLIITFFGIFWVLRYAKKIKKDPAKSPVFREDKYWRDRQNAEVEGLRYYTNRASWLVFFFVQAVLIYYSFDDGLQVRETVISIGKSYRITLPIIPVLTLLFPVLSIISLRKSIHFFILTLLLYTILFLITGVMGYQWYITKIAGLFFAMGILSGIAMGNGANDITKLFLEGAKDIMSAALVVGLAGGILVILEDGKVIDSILYYVSKAMGNMGKVGTVSIMYGIQTAINIIIPSGSAKAALTMPVMAPFSDLVGLSRQATVMAFQFGDGFTNMITPTSGVLIGVLGVAKIPYQKWVKWILPFMIALMILGWLLLLPTVLMQLPGF